MSEYQYRFVIIYWVSYLDEFISSCEKFLQQKPADMANINDLYTGTNYEMFKDHFDVVATSSIFADKLGKHNETHSMFQILGFEPILHSQVSVKSYRAKKSRQQLERIGKVTELLRKIANMEV